MKLKNILIVAVSTIAPLLTLLPPFTPIAVAQQGVQNEVRLGACSSRVVGLQPGSEVNMRSAPNINSDIQNIVLVGQTVTNLVTAATGNIISQQDAQGNTWMYVAYSPRNAVGWIRSDFLSSPSCNPDQGNSGVVCSARVVGLQPGSEVNMRSAPNINSDIQNVVLVGQTVLVVATTGNIISQQDVQGNTWMYVTHRPSNAVGWVRSDFLSSLNCNS